MGLQTSSEIAVPAIHELSLAQALRDELQAVACRARMGGLTELAMIVEMAMLSADDAVRGCA